MQQLVIETAFGDDDADLAQRSRHLHPRQLAAELSQWPHAGDVYITHIKPGEEMAVMRAVRSHELPHRIQALQSGQTMAFGAPVRAAAATAG